MNRRDFLQKSLLATCGIAAASTLLNSCSDDVANPIPPQTPPSIDFTIDISTPKYNSLQTNGNYLYANNIIIARDSTGNFVALSQVCTHAGCTIMFNGTNEFPCPCHGSTYNENGGVLRGPSVTPLKSYNTQLSGTLLRIWG